MGEGSDPFRRCHEIVPGIAAGIDDILVGFVKPVGELVLAEVLPDVFGGVELWGVGRQGYDGDIIWNNKFFAAMPASSVKDEHGMSAGRDGFGDFLQVQVHRLRIGIRHHDSRARLPLRAHGAEEISPFVTGIADYAGPAAFARPNPGQRALLANARLVLEPDFDRLCFGVLRQVFP